MRWRWLGILGGIVGVALIVILILPSIIDANRFRPKMESDLSLALNRKVSIGNVRLAILSGGVKVYDLSVADDPAFSSEPFVHAKSLTVGVEFRPLIFSHQVHITAISIGRTQIALLRSKAGAWNYSTLGPARVSSPVASSTPAPGGIVGNLDYSIDKFSIDGADVLIGDAGSSNKPSEYANVELKISDLSYTSQFPFTLSAKTPGNGTLKIKGQAGPLSTANLAETPVTANLNVQDFNLASSGLVDPASGIGGILDFTGNFVSDGQRVHSQGKIHAVKFQFAPNATPSTAPVDVDYGTEYQWKPQTGTLTQGDVHVGNALAQLAGTYSLASNEAALEMKLHGDHMPAPDLQSILPALGMALPSGSSLQSGILDVNLTLAGAVNSLVTSGSVNLSNATLAGFNLGAKLGGISSLAGLPKTSDTVIQELSSNVSVAPGGIRADDVKVIVPGMGTIAGNGTVAPDHKLNFKMSAKLASGKNPIGGGLAALTSVTQGSGGVPFLIHGTTASPKFEPDLTGMVKGIATAPGHDAGALFNGLLGTKKKP
ncbi:MAG: AsmA family protein [Candidatus Acidiferrales bacterium]